MAPQILPPVHHRFRWGPRSSPPPPPGDVPSPLSRPNARCTASSLGCTYRSDIATLACPAMRASVHTSHLAAQVESEMCDAANRVRMASPSDAAIAFACFLRMVEGSMCPLFVLAGNIQPLDGLARRRRVRLQSRSNSQRLRQPAPRGLGLGVRDEQRAVSVGPGQARNVVPAVQAECAILLSYRALRRSSACSLRRPRSHTSCESRPGWRAILFNELAALARIVVLDNFCTIPSKKLRVRRFALVWRSQHTRKH